MSRFEDRLLAHLIDAHATELGQEGPRAARGTRRRRGAVLSLAAACAALVAAVIATLAVVLTSGGGTPAYAVEAQSGGTVVLTLNEMVGVEGANAQLSKLGVRAVIARVDPACQETGVVDRSHGAVHGIVQLDPDDATGAQWVIDAAAIPAGDVLGLSAQQPEGDSHVVAYAINLYRGHAPACTRPGTFYSG